MERSQNETDITTNTMILEIDDTQLALPSQIVHHCMDGFLQNIEIILHEFRQLRASCYHKLVLIMLDDALRASGQRRGKSHT